jgi:hypothetical protein
MSSPSIANGRPAFHHAMITSADKIVPRMAISQNTSNVNPTQFGKLSADPRPSNWRSLIADYF